MNPRQRKRVREFTQEDLQVEVTASAYQQLREYDVVLADSMTPRDRMVFEGGVAAGCRAIIRMLREDAEADG